MDRRSLGQLGEEKAVAYLKDRGYRILARNWKCQLGEIDIVAFKGGAFVFVEVKTLASQRANELRPEDHMTFQKVRKVMRLAEYYLATQKRTGTPYQVDLVAVEWHDNDGSALRHIERIA